ncbi:GNAT family N-acetyltransferase [Bacillaceae bacterium SIJ1]|uniref:GNAT family N-acetyltransferase n=1 Tax=Litoribacterium kuwaitense TaxID=1398745 RepID=UPI0013ED5B09|nr:GNAT family N-acetyltransferase [Litoribacterium kuwaitense]NGP44631.1 GNAT family N-acetyltransferase [Litoribacterium kuwaitense]
MISELTKSDFHKCLGIINEQGQIEARAIIAGINPGRIFVDHTTTPTSGLIWLGNHDGFIFIGDESNAAFNEEINAFIDDVIMPEAKSLGLKWFEAIGNHEKWNATIEKLFTHRQLGSWLQKVYMLKEKNDQHKIEPVLESEYTVHQMTKSLYENKDNSIKNIAFLHEKILAFWSTPDRFFREGNGYCIIYKNDIVSVCFSGFVFENIHCIDIETLEVHQGKKLAQSIAHHFVKNCFENHLVPYWDCMDANKPSVAVAENMGFVNTFNYTGYDFSFEH